MTQSPIVPVEFVYFDLGNVLARFDVARACNNVADRWRLDPQRVRQVLWQSGVQDRFEHGHFDEEAVAQWARSAFELTPTDAPTDAWMELLSDMFEPISEMQAVVDSVRTSGMRLGILSNTCVAHWRWLLANDYPVLKGKFDAVVLSYEVGAMKPDPQIYEVAERLAGVAAERILFFDDRSDNIDAALARCWQAHTFTDAASACETLVCAQVLA